MGAQWKAKGKAQAADARGKLFGRLAKDIMVAARSGADPAGNAKLRLVLEQPRLRSALRKRGLVQAARFSWRRSAEQTLAIYEEIARPRR